MNAINLVYLYLLSPLHTGGTTQEGNLLGIAREAHTNLPYIPSSTIRGRLRALASSSKNGDDKSDRFFLFGNEIADGEQLEQGTIWIGDGSILWIPIPSLSHGVIWVTSPMLLRRWARLSDSRIAIPGENFTNIPKNGNIYLKDAILKKDSLHEWKEWEEWKKAIPNHSEVGMDSVLVLADKHCATIVQMSLWRQVKVKLDEYKTVDGGFRYEEAIPPDTLMYFPWGTTAQANDKHLKARSSEKFKELLNNSSTLQIGGQESLGRGFVQLIIKDNKSEERAKA
ncbi:MAG: type III-B CRISPR module RAMP protein Cmr4 [Pseudanabaenaceae cyanobacterium]